MGDDKTTERVVKNRAVLGDLTNQSHKRNLTSIQGGSEAYAGDYKSKRVCLGVEEILKGKSGTKCQMDGNLNGLPSLKNNQERMVSVVSNMTKDIKVTAKALEGSCDHGNGCAEKVIVPRTGGPSKDTVVSCDSVPASVGIDDEERIDCGITESDAVFECLGSQTGTNIVADDGSGLKQYGPAQCPELPTLQGSRSFELTRCSVPSKDCMNLSAGSDPLKECSCSFCLKAGYIWLDLISQDRKGRLAALKKSQKEASILVSKTYRGKEAQTHSIANPSKSSVLESSLSSQWRSLFLHMEDTFLREGSQIQASLAALEELREKCKTALETKNGKSFDK